MQDLLIQNGKVLKFKKLENKIKNIENVGYSNPDIDVIIEEKDILVKDGKIAKIENKLDEKQYPESYKIDATNHIVMPGLINTHAHVPMSIFRETTEGCNLYDWLHEKIWPREDKLTQEDVYWTSMLSFIEMIATGTTCINDHYFMSEAVRKAAEVAKIRIVLTRVLMDTDGKQASQNRVEEFKRLYETRNPEQDLITYSISPHSLYTCSDKCLQTVADLVSKYHLPVHIHFLESIDEIQDIQNQHGKNAIQILKEYFGDVPTILAHGVHLNDQDIAILKTMNCGIAHNPISNLRLGCGIADTTKYLQNDINVALGTDGQGSGSNLDMFEAMRTACLIQGGIHENKERINAKDVLKMATMNGATLLQLEKKVGSIEIGKDADIILVDIEEKLQNITMLPNLNEIANLVYNTTGRNVTTTIVKGNVLMENRKLLGIDVKEVIEHCKEISQVII